MSVYRGVGLSRCQTIDMSAYCGVGISIHRSIEVLGFQGVRLSSCRTIEVSDYLNVCLSEISIFRKMLDYRRVGPFGVLDYRRHPGILRYIH